MKSYFQMNKTLVSMGCNKERKKKTHNEKYKNVTASFDGP